MRLNEVTEVLGTLTDGRIWHTIKFHMVNNMLKVMKYTKLIAKDDIEVIGGLPNLLVL